MGRGRKPSPKGGEASTGYVPPMPSGMSVRAEAKWSQVVPLVANMVGLREADADSLRQYCEAAVLREKAVAEFENEPLLESGPNGARYANPLLKIINQTEATMQKIGERFGLDPSSRRRLEVEAQKADSAFAEFLKHGRARPKPEAAEGG